MEKVRIPRVNTIGNLTTAQGLIGAILMLFSLLAVFVHESPYGWFGVAGGALLALFSVFIAVINEHGEDN